MEDNKFDFNHCPECGGSVKWDGIFVGAGRHARCRDCGKVWHVIWDNADKYPEDDSDGSDRQEE